MKQRRAVIGYVRIYQYLVSLTPSKPWFQHVWWSLVITVNWRIEKVSRANTFWARERRTRYLSSLYCKEYKSELLTSHNWIKERCTIEEAFVWATVSLSLRRAMSTKWRITLEQGDVPQQVSKGAVYQERYNGRTLKSSLRKFWTFAPKKFNKRVCLRRDTNRPHCLCTERIPGNYTVAWRVEQCCQVSPMETCSRCRIFPILVSRALVFSTDRTEY